MWILAVAELLIGAVVFWLSFRSFLYGGKGIGFKIYAGIILIVNLIIALCRKNKAMTATTRANIAMRLETRSKKEVRAV